MDALMAVLVASVTGLFVSMLYVLNEIFKIGKTLKDISESMKTLIINEIKLIEHKPPRDYTAQREAQKRRWAKAKENTKYQ